MNQATVKSPISLLNVVLKLWIFNSSLAPVEWAVTPQLSGLLPLDFTKGVIFFSVVIFWLIGVTIIFPWQMYFVAQPKMCYMFQVLLQPDLLLNSFYSFSCLFSLILFSPKEIRITDAIFVQWWDDVTWKEAVCGLIPTQSACVNESCRKLWRQICLWSF